MRQKAYARAGVDIALGNIVKATLPELLASAQRPEVLGKVGGFGGLFALNFRKYREPILVSSVDGVGTKLKIAFATGRHDTVGQDLVNHCANDIAVLGAEPLFFLDYIGTGKLEPRVFKSIIKGFVKGCVENNCALIGGETAQMPGFYKDREYDLSGTIVGVVEKSRLIDGKTVRPGDAVLGLASNGLHTNGYSLARRIFFDKLKLKADSHVRELRNTIGAELLKVHLSYSPLILELLRQFNAEPARRNAKHSRGAIKALAHITGGGFVDNIPRMLPKTCDVVVRKNSWPLPPLFRLLREKGGVAEDELYQVFNMGIGMTAIVDGDRAEEILKTIKARKFKAWVIGEVRKGRGRVEVI